MAAIWWIFSVVLAFVSCGPLLFYSVEKDIEDHRADAERIIDLALNGKAKGQVYDRLSTFVDKFGSRISGSRNLEDAIDYVLEKLKEDGLENVHGELAMVPHWIRGKESATLLKPRTLPLNILGLGSSIATPPGGITAEVVVVKSFDELAKRAEDIKGKIVVYNQEFKGYHKTVKYRTAGASEASKFGAVATLIRSVTPFSIDSPHTGAQSYQANVTKIPTACITVEIAKMLNRMQDRGHKIVINLQMSALNLPPVPSRNVVAEIQGWKYPDEAVIVSGHIDSWDVGQGASDDGGGAFISWETLSLIHQLGLRPKRTLKAIMWTSEEEGYQGARQYFADHYDELQNEDLIFETDEGTDKPKGIQFSGNKAATDIIKHVAQLLSSVNMSTVYNVSAISDVEIWEGTGVPLGSIETKNEKYYYFHHTNGDMMNLEDPRALDLCTVVWAVTAYVVADLEIMLPRDELHVIKPFA